MPVRCERCGTTRADDAVDGVLCPACLLRLALELPAGDEDRIAGDEADVPVGLGGPAVQVLTVLGSGRHGVTYLARRGGTSSLLTLKLVRSTLAREHLHARVTALLKRLGGVILPNVARPLDAGVTGDGHAFLVGDFLAGMPVTDYFERWRLPRLERRQHLALICETVQHLHDRGLAHGHLSPANVLVSAPPGGARLTLLDTGIAGLAGPAPVELDDVSALALLIRAALPEDGALHRDALAARSAAGLALRLAADAPSA